MNKKRSVVILLVIIGLNVFLLSRKFCLLGPGQQGIIGQWWTAPGPQGDITVCCPLDVVCL